jgi:hypothetical protein
MKKIMFILFYGLIGFSLAYSQNTGTSLIYNSGNFGIAVFEAIKPLNSGIKEIYIQLGRYNYFNSMNESGRFLKLNKMTNSWYIPHNGALNAAWGQDITGMNDCEPIPFFTKSSLDSNQIIKFEITPAASCPDAHTLATTNSGVNYLQTPFNCGGAIICPYGGDYNPKRINELIFGYGVINCGIFKSTNAGVNWSLIFPINDLRQSCGWVTYNSSSMFGFIKYNPFDTSFVYANGMNNLYISTNGGYNFSASQVKWMKNIIFSWKDSVIYGFNNLILYRSSNKGLVWDSVPAPVKFSALEVNPDFSNILYGGDSNGIYISTNSGFNWTLYNNSFTPSKIIKGISKDPGTGDTFYVATTKNVYKVWASFLVGIENISNSLPKKYNLYQNFPNPFNPTTKIKFDISTENKFPLSKGGLKGVVSLKIYDITGREIQTLVNEKLNPGTYEVTFDGSNVASGVYFCQLRSGSFIETKKLVLLK